MAFEEADIVKDALAQGYYEQYEKKIYDQKQLIFISKALNSNLDLSSLIESILNISLAQSQTFQVGVYLKPDVERHEFVLNENSIGFDVEEHLHYILGEKSAFIQGINSSSRGTFTFAELEEINNANGNSSDEEMDQLRTLSDNLLVIPLRARGKVNGIIILGPKTSGEPYLSSELDFLADLASIAAIAVENARLYELATTDMMTRLKIHHFFQTRLREEMEECRENGIPVSLLMTDIDHFKKFNDTYGHQQGDVVLKEVAGVLINLARSLDLPARYGGEEFAMILPKTRLEEAGRIAEKIRSAVEKLRVKNHTDTGEKTLNVTTSVGVAECNPETDLDNKSLIQRCDDALYEAKHNGRNRVEIG